jgi:hypothetical protein
VPTVGVEVGVAADEVEVGAAAVEVEVRKQEEVIRFLNVDK